MSDFRLFTDPGASETLEQFSARVKALGEHFGCNVNVSERPKGGIMSESTKRALEQGYDF